MSGNEEIGLSENIFHLLGFCGEDCEDLSLTC